eukprot:g33454.t1
MHQEAVKRFDQEGLQASGARVLVYSCQPFAQCGGHGDRLNGIITVFLLAVLTGRVFLIDSESPLPLQLLLQPRDVDWRVRRLKRTRGRAKDEGGTEREGKGSRGVGVEGGWLVRGDFSGKKEANSVVTALV